MEQKVIIDEGMCKSCELCVNVCPKHVLRISNKINLKGYHPVELLTAITYPLMWLVCSYALNIRKWFGKAFKFL